MDPHVVAAVGDPVRNHLDLFRDLDKAAAHEALDRIDRPFRVGDHLVLRRLADQPPLVGERDDRRRGALPLRVLHHRRFAALHHRDAGIGGPQVNADDLAHVMSLPFVSVGASPGGVRAASSFRAAPLRREAAEALQHAGEILLYRRHAVKRPVAGVLYLHGLALETSS